MNAALPLVVDALAAYRVTRLATADTIFHGPRDAIVRWSYRRQGREAVERPMPEVPGAWAEVAMADDDPPKLATLVTCRWCMGVWVAAGVVAARRYWPEAWGPAADTMALAALAALIARAED